MHSYIAPYARGHGLARMLTTAVEDRARELGYHVLNLDVRETQDRRDPAVRIARLRPLGRASRLCPGARQVDRGLLLLTSGCAESSRDRTERVRPAQWISRMTALTLYPAIDLKDGQCVRLRRGEMDQATVYADDPGAQAQAWQDAGFAWLHVVDLNGAFAGQPVNAAAVAIDPRHRHAFRCSLAAASATWPGIETLAAAGVRRVILGSAAAKNPSLVHRGLPGLSAAASPSASMRATASSPPKAGPRPRPCAAADLALRFEDAGVSAIIYTDIGRDGMLSGLNLEQTAGTRAPADHAGHRLGRRRLAWTIWRRCGSRPPRARGSRA